MFFFCGLFLMTPGDYPRLRGLWGIMMVAALGAVFNWVAFGSGERHFSGTTSIFGVGRPSKISETEGRVAFGVFAVLIDVFFIMMCRSFARSLLDPDAPPPMSFPEPASAVARPVSAANALRAVTFLAAAAIAAAVLSYSVVSRRTPPPTSEGSMTITSSREAAEAEFFATKAGKAVLRGQEKVNGGEAGSALADFNEAIRLAPDRAIAYENRGTALQMLRRDAEALDDYNQAIRIKPNDPVYHLLRGTLLASMGRIDDARVDCARLKELDEKASSPLCSMVKR